ncbi:MAG: family 16 glycosylhydrolase [Marinilabiliales bacterium]|nr:family 16 glycosylhydrolase [Marinilabiliales bacterium]
MHHAFWMLGEKITPEIDIFKYDSKSKGKTSIASYWGNPTEEKGIKKIKSSVSGPNLSSDYFIYTLHWTPEKLTWKINNVPVYEITEGVPQEPMYVLLSSGIVVNGSSIQLPCTMEVDWIRVYQEKQ